jgi:hypothetical protein
MNERAIEDRLRKDAEELQEELQASCPPHVRHAAVARIREEGRRRRKERPRLPSAWAGLSGLAGACALVVIGVSVWSLWAPTGSETPAAGSARPDRAPILATNFASPDRLIASREAALEDEWRRLEGDLRELRAEVTASFTRKPNG